jgi:glycosyltransferase involved in cell wall biosynthesis
VSDPAITVGLPVYNGEPFLGKSIESIIGQTYADLRLVISDNASTDDTEGIARGYARDDDRITYERQDENRGAAWNYNRTFHLSSSPYFKWAAADDMLAPTCVERSIATLEEDPTVVMCYPRTLIIDAEGNVVRGHDDGLDAMAPTPHRRFGHVVRNVVLGNGIFGVVRRDALAQTRLHGNYPSADWVFLAELALVGKIREVPEPLFLRRLHEGTSRVANTNLDDLMDWFDPAAAKITNERSKLYHEYLGAIRHAKLSRRERALTHAVFQAVWARRHSRVARRIAAHRRPGA